MAFPTEAEDLPNALTGMGISEAVVNIFGNLSKHEMQNFFFREGLSLEDVSGLTPILNYDHDEETEARFLACQNALAMYSQHPFERDAILLQVALKDLENFYQKKVVVELMCTRTLPEIVGATMAYQAIYQTTFKEDLKAFAPKNEDYQMLLGLYEIHLKGKIDLEHTRRNGDFLQTVGVGKGKGFFKKLTDDRIARLNSWINNNTELSFDEDVKTSKLFKVIQQCVGDPIAYFITVLEDAFSGRISARSRDNLTRVIVTRNNIDLVLINEQLIKNGQKSLFKRISSTCVGDYKDFLLNLVPAEAGPKTPQTKKHGFFSFR